MKLSGAASHNSHSEATAVEDINSHLVVPSGPAANYMKDVASERNKLKIVILCSYYLKQPQYYSDYIRV